PQELLLETGRQRKAIGDDFGEVVGLQAMVTKTGQELSAMFTTLDLKVAKFHALANDVLHDDPLGKLLKADWDKALALGEELTKAFDAGTLRQGDFQKLLDDLFSGARARRTGLVDQFAK